MEITMRLDNKSTLQPNRLVLKRQVGSSTLSGQQALTTPCYDVVQVRNSPLCLSGL